MKKSGSHKHTGRNIALAALLAVLCIGATELAACKYFAPEAYERIVAPARYAASVAADAALAAADAGKAALDAAGRFCLETGRAVSRLAGQAADRAALFWEELTAVPEEPVPQETLPTEDSAPPVQSGKPAEPIAAPLLTEMLDVDDRQVLTGGNVDVTYFCQSSEEWADQPYGTDTIGPYGCGPTVMAMAVDSLTDVDTDPAGMASWAVDHGYWARRSGSYHSIVLGTAHGFGIEAETFPSRDADALRDALWDHKVLVALMGPGHFTTGGHFILLRGITLSGEILIADPNSPEHSLMLWDAQLILDELSSARDHGAPLWILSIPDT